MKKLIYIFTMMTLVFVSNLNPAMSATKAEKKSILIRGRIDFNAYGNISPMQRAYVELHNDKLGVFPKNGAYITGSDGIFYIDVEPNASYNIYVNGRFVKTTQTLATKTDLPAVVGGASKMQKIISNKRVTTYATPRS